MASITKIIKAFLNLSPETCSEPILFDGPEGGININPAFCNIWPTTASTMKLQSILVFR